MQTNISLAGQPLAGQRAIVTGASSGIGAAIAKGLAAAGATVAVNYSRDEAGAARIVGEIEADHGHAVAIKADVSREDDVLAMFRRTLEAFGSIDIMVNNAGLQKDAPFVDMTMADWDRVIGVNLTGQFLCSREAAREFLRRGLVPTSRALGKIICISSVHDVIPWAGHANYAASKGGVSMLMKTMAQELAQHGIRVNAVSPGAIKTPINHDAWATPEAEKSLLRLIPYGRVGEPVDIGRAVTWLASDDSDYVNGATLYVDGGMTMFPEFRFGG
ncbi:MAG TPA: glucose 1-dehydrogenase [Polyangiaceae bacterium]|jgi:glucose 1-dehydrogenase|nr:glucose 1-dehydrogenase [Polyangiaceae bacterium]